ncbi:hypothetical protein [Arsukibacterium sp.]|uniref:hypothetical protein n=1 Tax=Arsukibacterium sp. TaxID=1977258 RepID=UPI001BD60710|nr:hypothetical protein [Arsukibacterium sp.]
MNKIYIGLLAGLTFGVSANAYKSEIVEVSIKVDEGKQTFRLVCKPKMVRSELPANWVDSCNGIGEKLLELAVENGMKLNVVAKPFGKAGDLAQKTTAELPENVMPTEIISPEFGG